MSDFKAQYKDARWVWLREHVMDRANGLCEECGGGSGDGFLNVHHTYYERDLKIWEYPPESLRCLCRICHANMHAAIDEIKRNLGKLSLGDMEWARIAVRNLANDQRPKFFAALNIRERRTGPRTLKEVLSSTAAAIPGESEKRPVMG